MTKKYTVANTPAEALALKKDNAIYLAGGTEINRLDSPLEGRDLVSLKAIDAIGDIRKEEDKIIIGARVTFQQMIDSDLIPDWLKEAGCFMASRTKRNMATIGGNIAAARDDSYLIPTLIAVGADLKLLDESGDRICSALDYVGGSGCSSDARCPYPNALIVEVIIPLDCGFVKSVRVANTAQSHAALTLAFAAKKFASAEMAVAVKNGGIYYLTDLMKAIRTNPDVAEKELVDMVLSCEGASFPDDIYGSGKYKRYLLGTLVSQLRDEAKKGGLA